MANKIHQGEPLVIAGQLKDNNVVTIAYGLRCEVRSLFGDLLQSVDFTIDTANEAYSCSIDTSRLYGEVLFRFIASTSNGDIIVNDEDIKRRIYK